MQSLLAYHPARWQKLVQRLAATRVGSAVLAPILHYLDAPFIKLSNGGMTLTSLLTGLPVVTLTTVGAKTGQPRRVTLVAIPMETPEGQTGPEAQGKIILVASNFGRPHHPAWYYNLRANPLVTVTANRITGRYVSHEAAGEERRACWQRAAFLYSGYNAYRQRASQRDIGVFVLTPVEAETVSRAQQPSEEPSPPPHGPFQA
jgi:deazaflavin-dependent oxidoreductase (nitroreductase family)